MDKLDSYFEKLSKNNKLSQAFLIGNVFFDDIKNDLINCIQKYMYNNEKIFEDIDYYLLKKDNLKADNIKKLISDLNITSQTNDLKIYIIDQCENLNSKSYNSLLKILEEPPQGVIAILLSNNIDDVPRTIKSRCQIIFLHHANNLCKNDIDNKIILDLIKNIESKNVKIIAENNEIYSIIGDRNKLINILTELLFIYDKFLNSLIFDEKYDNSILFSENTIESLSKKIIVINKNLNLLKNNLSKNLSLDKFIIDMWRCNL